MADTQITWRGLALGGGGDLHVDSITGWDEYPEITDFSEARVRAHGDHAGDLYSRARIVTATGSIASPANRNTLAQQLMAATRLGSAIEDLTIETFGQSLTSGARLIRRSLNIDSDGYAAGAVPFALQWRCPDPLRYGAAVTASTGLPVVSGGLTYSLAYSLTYGAAGNPGQLTIRNGGTADTTVVFTVSGSLPLGFAISSTSGELISYPLAVGASQPVVIDTGAGTVLLEGTSDRRAYLTSADWMTVPAGTSRTFQFTSLGGTYDPTATLTASVKPAYW